MPNNAEMAPGYEPVVRQLRSAEVEASASEVHGLFCGLLCSGTPDAPALWCAELFGDIESSGLPAKECQQLLERLFQYTIAQLEDPGSGLSLLLPDDGRPLKLRAGALVEWCQGFLYGLGLSGVSELRFSGETREALRDLAEITRMDQQKMEESEENEEAFMEISEFIRIAAMLVREHMIAGLAQDS